MQIKQALYAFDFDQTYDLLWSEYGYIPVAINNSLFQSFENGVFPITLIERYTPDNFSWANQWIDYYFEFLKVLSRIHLTQNRSLMGTAAGFEPAIRWAGSDPRWRIQSTTLPRRIIFRKTSNNPVSVTWLERSTREGYRCGIYLKQCQIINKKHLILTDNSPKTILGADVMRNSLVFSEPNSVTIEAQPEQIEALLYSEIENQIEDFIRQMQLTQFRILKTLDITIDYELEMGDWRDFPRPLNKAYLNSRIDVPTVFSNPEYIDVPDWYYFASIVRANNNPWGNLDGTEDKGKSVSCLWDSENQLLDFKIWNLGEIIADDLTFPWWQLEFEEPVFKYLNTANFSNISFNWTLGQTAPSFWSDNYWLSALIGINNSSLNPTLFPKNDLRIGPNRTGASFDFLHYMEEENRNGFTRSAIGGSFNLIEPVSPYLIQSNIAFLFHPFIFRAATPPGEEIYTVKNDYTIGTILSNENQEISATKITDITQTSSFYIGTRWSGLYDNNGNPIEIDINFPVSHNLIFTEPNSVTKSISLSIWESEPLGKNQLTDLQVKELVDSIIQANWYEYWGFNDPQEYWEFIVMPDSIRIKEIHAALEAQTYSSDPDNPLENRVANLGYLVERMARVLGISVNPNGSIRSIRQSKFIEAGKNLPAGWPIGQWGRNEGGDTQGQPGGTSDQERDGLAYEVRSNRVTTNPFTGVADKIDLGGYVLVENLPQLIHVLLDDLDKGLGWQEAGSNIIPDANNQGRFASYEGMNSLLVEVAYMLSDLSRNIKGSHVSSLITQATLYEVLGALGLPINFKTLKVEAEGNKEIHYPALDKGSPTLADLFFLLALNLSPLVGGKLNLYPKNEEEK
jgi:hypothetical protein